MARTVLTPRQLPGALKREARKVRRAIERATMRAAQRGKARLVRATEEKGKTYLGQYRNSFHVKRVGRDGAEIVNDAPHAGIVELGARPHPVSEEGREAIREWVTRKLLGVSVDLAEQNEEVDAIVWGIVRKLNLHGQEPTYIFRDELDTLTRYLREEVERLLAQPPPAGGGA